MGGHTRAFKLDTFFYLFCFVLFCFVSFFFTSYPRELQDNLIEAVTGKLFGDSGSSVDTL